MKSHRQLPKQTVLGDTEQSYDFFGDPQKSMLDDEQSAPDELEAGEIEEADEPESEMPENSIYEGYTDEELLVHIRTHEGNEALDYLVNKYRNFVRSKARSYFLIGADREDIVQEGMIGFFKAIRDFREDKLSSFRAFAELCVTRQIITAIKTATRQKHIPLNSYVSLNKPIYDEDSDRTLLDVLSGARISDPEELVISREEFVDIEKKMEEILSDLEWRVLMSYLDGKSYQEIAVDLHRQVKSIDNALQRVKRKLEKYMESRGEELDIGTVYRGLTTINRTVGVP
ncbi:RNA polymerase sigma-H factor [Selenomonas sp. oral taxon 137 str. F0430]|nr:RNA polymerase sigma-H factor [Selenomonas sp. oral taxon 137 str. F0430]